MKKKILVIGNYTDAIYHGLAGVDKRLTSILSDYELICTDDTSKLLSLEKDHISGIISYLDIWQSKLYDDEANAFEHFCSKRRRCTLLHNGISIQSQDRLLTLAGAKFLGHPHHEVIRFEPSAHPVTEGCKAFLLMKNLINLSLCQITKIILTYQYKNQKYPAGWCKNSGKGRLIYLCPGHTPEIFDCPQYQQLIRQSMD